jgi:hypothetical protein
VTDALCRCYLGTTSHVELPTRNRVVMGKLLVVVLQGHLKRSKASTGPIRSPIPTPSVLIALKPILACVREEWLYTILVVAIGKV